MRYFINKHFNINSQLEIIYKITIMIILIVIVLFVNITFNDIPKLTIGMLLFFINFLFIVDVIFIYVQLKNKKKHKFFMTKIKSLNKPVDVRMINKSLINPYEYLRNSLLSVQELELTQYQIFKINSYIDNKCNKKEINIENSKNLNGKFLLVLQSEHSIDKFKNNRILLTLEELSTNFELYDINIVRFRKLKNLNKWKLKK